MKSLIQLLNESDYNYLDNEPEVKALIKKGLKISNGYKVKLNLRIGRGGGYGSIYTFDVEKESNNSIIGNFTSLQVVPTKELEDIYGKKELVGYTIGKQSKPYYNWATTYQDALNNIIKRKK